MWQSTMGMCWRCPAAEPSDPLWKLKTASFTITVEGRRHRQGRRCNVACIAVKSRPLTASVIKSPQSGPLPQPSAAALVQRKNRTDLAEYSTYEPYLKSRAIAKHVLLSSVKYLTNYALRSSFRAMTGTILRCLCRTPI